MPLPRYGFAQVSWDASAPQVRPYNALVSNQKLKAAGYEALVSRLIYFV
jgi:hypothetical protein